VSFSSKTHYLIENGKKKLEKKKVDAICINEVYKELKGFGTDINSITYLDKYGKELIVENDTKENIARKIVNLFMMD